MSTFAGKPFFNTYPSYIVPSISYQQTPPWPTTAVMTPEMRRSEFWNFILSDLGMSKLDGETRQDIIQVYIDFSEKSKVPKSVWRTLQPRISRFPPSNMTIYRMMAKVHNSQLPGPGRSNLVPDGRDRNMCNIPYVFILAENCWWSTSPSIHTYFLKRCFGCVLLYNRYHFRVKIVFPHRALPLAQSHEARENHFIWLWPYKLEMVALLLETTCGQIFW